MATLPPAPMEAHEPAAYAPLPASLLALHRLRRAVCAAELLASLPIHVTMHVGGGRGARE